MSALKKLILWFNILFLLQLSKEGYGDRVKDKMYEEIAGISACFRRLNATHQIGCSSKRGGSTGVIHFCKTEKDLEDLINHGTADPYIPVLPVYFFNLVTLTKVTQSNKISGLILHSNNETLTSNFTHEHECPNPLSSVADTCKKDAIWNPWGTGLLYTDISIPIFYVEDQKDIETIKDCFEKFNNYSYQEQMDRPLCSLELSSFMYASTNSPTCIRRSNIVSNLNPQKFCDPLGDNNIWASLHPLADGSKRNETKAIKDYRYVVVAARLDTTSMFETTSGASSPVTGIVTLLSVAKYLNDTLKLEDVKKAKKNVLFFLFNGETYDYIGSQRMLYDMLEGNFPTHKANDTDILPAIGLENIDLFVEFSQLGNAKQKLYTHFLKEQESVSNFITRLQNYNSPILSFEKVPQSLPPASLHTFLKNNSNFPGLLIADHKTAYSNHFYNSIYDNSTNIRFHYYNITKKEFEKIPKDSIQHLIVNVTKIVGDSIIAEVTGNEYNGETEVDVVLVNELLNCYLEDSNCKVHQAIQKGLNLPKTPQSLYVGVKGNEHVAPRLAGLTLGWFTGNTVGPGDVNCTNRPKNYAFKFYNMSKSIYELNVTMCYQVTMNTTEAVSPAFSIKDYDWLSGQYSTWTESVWKDFQVRVFLKPSAGQGKMTIAIGCITIVFSFVMVYFIKSRSHILFSPTIANEAPTDC